MFYPAQGASPGRAIDNLSWFRQRVGRQIIHIDQVVAAEQSFDQTAMLRHDRRAILRHPFLLPVFRESEHHKQLSDRR